MVRFEKESPLCVQTVTVEVDASPYEHPAWEWHFRHQQRREQPHARKHIQRLEEHFWDLEEWYRGFRRLASPRH